MTQFSATLSGPDDGGNVEYAWEGAYLQGYILSDIGKKRTYNEDRAALYAPETAEQSHEFGFLFAVADGMGGVSGGGFASKLALDALFAQYYQDNAAGPVRRLRAAVDIANRRVFDEAENHPEFTGMGTTVSAALILGDHAYVAQVGDSRVYLSRNEGQIWQITDDHSLVAEQVRNGYLSEEEARTHSLKNLITRAVGTKGSVRPDLFSVAIRRGDTLLICSDGLSNQVDDVQIAECLALPSLQGAARMLVGKALDHGGSDNITVVLVRVSGNPPHIPLDPGAVRVALAKGKPGFLGKLRRLILPEKE